ncbi:hypothetical protein [Erwinia sorbitola]|uniref:Uncharacterized protein n=1 Tax=Erwinia sorbitola TaxID=2681984 RepID=A0A6I6EM03_9GAMM|nr:hypothetical protein [Erwinia sorbitola]MTD27989.1 hypothetical protein [Erwinia sorbitola]QGU89578.1 hypothetical protein GN242_21315 [Erwinia sorbitola]
MSITVNGCDQAVKIAQSVAKKTVIGIPKYEFWGRIAADNFFSVLETHNDEARSFTADF